MMSPPDRNPETPQAFTFVRFNRSDSGNLVLVLQRKTAAGHKAIACEILLEHGGFDAYQVRDGLNVCLSALEKALPEKNRARKTLAEKSVEMQKELCLCDHPGFRHEHFAGRCFNCKCLRWNKRKQN